MLKNCLLVAFALLMSIRSGAQSTASAEGERPSLWVGVSLSTFNPDWGCTSSSPFSCWNRQLLGISPYVHTNAFLLNRIGAEAQARFLHWRGPGNLTESSYMGGPSISLLHRKAFFLSGRVLLGTGHLSLANHGLDSGTYFAYAPGVAVDYRVASRVRVRFDYDYQIWPTFKGAPTTGTGGLTPNGISLGLCYAVR